MQVLYHWNFGPPFLEEGSRFVAPIRTSSRATRGPSRGSTGYDIYGAPEPGFAEQVYFFELHGRSPRRPRPWPCSATAAGDKAVVLRFRRGPAPCVHPLEEHRRAPRRATSPAWSRRPTTPTPGPFEKARERVVALPPAGTYEAETTLEVLDTPKPSRPSRPRSRRCRPGARPRSTASPSNRSRRRGKTDFRAKPSVMQWVLQADSGTILQEPAQRFPGYPLRNFSHHSSRA